MATAHLEGDSIAYGETDIFVGENHILYPSSWFDAGTFRTARPISKRRLADPIHRAALPQILEVNAHVTASADQLLPRMGNSANN